MNKKNLLKTPRLHFVTRTVPEKRSILKSNHKDESNMNEKIIRLKNISHTEDNPIMNIKFILFISVLQVSWKHYSVP